MLGVGTTASQRTHGTHGTAKRVGKKSESTANTVVMTVVTCQDCCTQYAINHDAASPDAPLAARQAVWLADQLVWEHIQENKHRGSISLPAADQIK
jgi:hypothetical protein